MDLLKRALRFCAAFAFLAVPVGAEQTLVNQFGYLNNNESPVIIDNTEAQDLLNVDVTPGGKSVVKREGFGVYKTLTAGTGIHGGHQFFDSTGNDVQVWGSSTSLWGIVADGTPVQLVSSATLNATWDCADTQGFAYCVNSSRNALIKTNGAAITWYTSALGTMIDATPDRLIVAGVSGALNSIYYSESGVFNNFTAGINPTDPFIEVISGPGSRLTHIRYACGRTLWWKDKSFGYVLGSQQSDIDVAIISDTIGTIDNSSAIDPYGNVWFRAQDGHIYKYDCAILSKESIAISPSIQGSGQRTSNSWTQTTQAEFQTGTIQPTNGLSTTILADAVVPSSASFTDTSSGDFGSFSAITTSIDTSTVSGAVSLKKYFSDDFTSFANWQSDVGSDPINETMIVSGGVVTCTSAASGSMCIGTSTQTVNNDFVISAEITTGTGNEARVGVTNSSNQGYSIFVGAVGGVVRIMREDNFHDLLSLNNICGSSTSLAGTHTYVLTRNSSTNVLSLYRDGTHICNATNSTYTSFSRLKLKADQSGATIDNVYDLARTGNFNSRVFDTSFSTPIYGTFNATVAGNGTTAFAVRTSSNSANSFSSDVVIATASVISFAPPRRYLVYSTTFTIVSSTVSVPQLTDVSFLAVSTGSYYSAVHNTPNMVTWDTLIANVSNDGGSHAFFVRSATNSFSILSSTPAWTAQTNGAAVTIATGTFVQLRDDFSLTLATQTPTLFDFSLNWFEGTTADKAYAVYFDDAIWWSLAFGAGQTINNYIFKYDILNLGWTIYNIATGGMLVQNNRLFFGSTTDGTIYRFGNTTSDNGSAINAYWKSKDFTGQDPFIDNAYKQIDFYATRDPNQTLSLAYSVGTSTSTTSYSVGLSSTTSSVILSRKLLPSGKIGPTFNLQFGDNTATSSWEALGFRFSFEPLPYRPTP